MAQEFLIGLRLWRRGRLHTVKVLEFPPCPPPKANGLQRVIWFSKKNDTPPFLGGVVFFGRLVFCNSVTNSQEVKSKAGVIMLLLFGRIYHYYVLGV